MSQVSKIRLVDITFNSDEQLWRRIAFEKVNVKGEIKPGAFRLQISVIRQKYNKTKNIVPGGPGGKWNGIAETTAGKVSGPAATTQIKIICIDSPTEEDTAHALIAATIDLDTCISPETSPETTRNIVRAYLTQKFKIDKIPTKNEFTK